MLDTLFCDKKFLKFFIKNSESAVIRAPSHCQDVLSLELEGPTAISRRN